MVHPSSKHRPPPPRRSSNISLRSRARTVYILSTVIVSAFLIVIFLRPASTDIRIYPAQFVRDKERQAASHARAQVPVAVPPPVESAHEAKVEQPWSVPAETISTELTYGSDGLVRGWEKIHADLVRAGRFSAGVSEEHPILDLMERGKRRWDRLLKSQSKTLDQAVATYVKRYNRQPPKGFDKWFAFCQKHSVKIVDDYDQIERDIAPWHGIAPAEFRKRVDALEDLPHSYKITLRPNAASEVSGVRATFKRPKLAFDLLEALAPYLPEDITLYGSDHDMGNWIMPDQYRNAALDAAAKGTYLTEEELKSYEAGGDGGFKPGLLRSCNPDSLARKLNGAPPEADSETTFVYDPVERMSYCDNPELMTLHGCFTWPQRREAKLRPVFQLSKPIQNGEFLTTPLEAYFNATSQNGMDEASEWSEKTISKLFWRGASTGDAYTQPKASRPDYDWRTSHRPRLHLFGQRTEGEAKVWVKRDDRRWDQETFSISELNDRYLDVGLAGKVHQCDHDGTCEEMEKEIIFKDRVEPRDAAAYKYVIDVDGNGWSSRYHRLLASGSVVIKTTIYKEWMSDWLTPWVHYVPCNQDYSDIYDIMSFFVGPPNGKGTGHENTAKMIADNGGKFAREHWRWEDMQAYMFRLLLEYGRLFHDDRDEWSFLLE